MHPDNLGFEDTNVDSIFKILEKNTQTIENAVKQSDCSKKSYKLPLPRELDERNESEIKSYAFSQDLGSPNSVTIVRETISEDGHSNNKSPCDKDFSNNLYKYCKGVINPFLQDHPPDCPESKELLLRDAVVKLNAEFPLSALCYECPKPCPPPTCPTPPCPPKCQPPCPPPKCLTPCPPPPCPPPCSPPKCLSPCPPPKCPSPCPPKCPPPKYPSPCPPRCPPPCPPPKCPSPCPPKCPPPKCPPRCPPKCPPKNHLKICYGEEGPTICKECTRRTCPTYVSPKPYCPPPCLPKCPPKCPPKCLPPKCAPPCPPTKCLSPCPPKSPPPCPPTKCLSPCPPKSPPPCPPKSPPPCRPTKCLSPCPPKSPPKCLIPCYKKDPSPNQCCSKPCHPKSSIDKLLETFRRFSGETIVCKCCKMDHPSENPCPPQRPPPQCPPPCPTPCSPPPCRPPQCPPQQSPPPCSPPPCPPPQCPPPPCPPPQCPPPQCPPQQCPPPPCPPPQCPPPQSPPPQSPPPQCPPPQCPPPQCPPPECPPPRCPPPKCPTQQCPTPQCPPPPCPPPACPGLTIERKQPPGCKTETRSERKFLCPSECPNYKANSKIKLASPANSGASSKQCVCTNEKLQSARDAHHETLATLKSAVTDLVCKAYRSTQDAATIICCESAKQFENMKKTASTISSECVPPKKDKPDSPCPSPPKKVSETRSGTCLRRLSIVNLDTSGIQNNVEEKAEPSPKKSDTNTQSTNPLGFIFEKVESAVSMISDSLVFELPRPRSFNDSSSKYDVPTPAPTKPPSPTDIENLVFPAGTSQLFSTIKDRIWSMFTNDDKTNVSSRRSSTATLASDSDEDLMTRIID